MVRISGRFLVKDPISELTHQIKSPSTEGLAGSVHYQLNGARSIVLGLNAVQQVRLPLMSAGEETRISSYAKQVFACSASLSAESTVL